MSELSRSHIGQQVGNYRLIRLLGQGGFADVYLGEHIFLKTQAAIKLLSLRLDSDNMDSFLNEAQTIAKLRHPHIVHVFECGIEHGIPFLVMDYIPNGTLRQRYPRGSRLLPEQIVLYIQQIASALSYAHQQRLIHRDIKPENMLLGHNGEVLLSDFGLALTAQSSGSQTAKEMAGTVPYMAPEQLEGRPRIASDQYALGIVMYEWLCGERPFTGSIFEIMSQHMLTPPPSLRQKVPALSPAIEQVVFKSLAKDPAQRFENVLALSTALTNAVHGSIATYGPHVESARQSQTPLSPQSPGHEEQNTAFASTGGYTTPSTNKPTSFFNQPTNYPVTPSDAVPYRPGEQNSFSGHYPPLASGVALENFPKPQKRPRRFWAIVSLLIALLLVASSATFLVTHAGIASGPQSNSIVSHRGTTTTPQGTQTVGSTMPSSTQSTSAFNQPPPIQKTPPPTQTTPSPPPTQITLSPPPTQTTPSPTPTATLSPQPPTSVVLSVSASGISPTTQGALTIPSGTIVTLTVQPNHSLLPFQTYTMGIYATDPYGFSELQSCQYPDTATCSWIIAYSSSENTDYTKGKHTFIAFLGNIGGSILANSNSVTITWS